MNSIHIKKDVRIEELLNKLGECYNTLDFRCIAVKDKNSDKWKNLCFTGLFTHHNSENAKKEIVQLLHKISNLNIDKLSTIKLLYEVVEKSEIKHFISSLISGKVKISDVEFELREDFKQQYVHTSPLTGFELGYSEYHEYPCLIIQFSARESPDLLIENGLGQEFIEQGLLYGIDDLARLWLRLSDIHGHINGMLIFPVYLKIRKLDIDENKRLTLVLRMHKELIPLTNLLLFVFDEQNMPIEVRRLKIQELGDDVKREDFFVEKRINFKFESSWENCRIDVRVFVEGLGIIYHVDKYLGRAGRVRSVIDHFLEKYGYQRNTSYQLGGVDSLEWYVYHLLGFVYPLIWMGLDESKWKNVLEDFGIEETIDFFAIKDDEILLIECIQHYTTSKGEVGEREIRKLYHMKRKFSDLGLFAYPVLVCGDRFNENPEYFKKIVHDNPEIYFLFYDDLEQIRQNIHVLSSFEDLLRFCRRFVKE